MIIITLQRDKCIGCNYCVEVAPSHFQMSKKDGKTVLLNATNKKEFYTLKTSDYQALQDLESAKSLCPVHIISVKLV